MTRRNIVLMLLFVAFIGSIVVGASAKGCSNLFRRDEKDAGASGVIPQTPTGLTATAISSAQINLSWTDNDAYEQGFEIERKTGISGTYALVATVARNVTSYSNTTGLSAATAYYYRVRAYYVAPESKSAYSNEASATTPDTGWDMSFTLTATAISPTRVSLNWSDNFTAEIGFQIERKTGTGGTYAEVGTTGASIIIYNDDTVTQSTTYYYRVRPYYTSANGPYSTEAWAITSGISSNFWSSIAPTGLGSRINHVSVYADNIGMILWGGDNYTDGGIYSPTANSWTAMTSLTASLTATLGHTALWDSKGKRMIVWGGEQVTAPNVSKTINTGAMYYPITDTWVAMPTTDAPATRTDHTAIWTGDIMIVWGGQSVDQNGETRTTSMLNKGGIYDPSWGASGAWLKPSFPNFWNGTDAPSARRLHSAVWTGGVMIVWGGEGGSNTGGMYSPTTDLWIPDMSATGAPSARKFQSCIWTGPGSESWRNKMIIWGGTDGGTQYFNTGGIYNPVLNNWTSMTTSDAPLARMYHSTVWTGSKMIVWGGGAGILEGPFYSGGVYDPEKDSWTPTATATTPKARTHHSGVWDPINNLMLIWGGWDPVIDVYNNGGAYTSD